MVRIRPSLLLAFAVAAQLAVAAPAVATTFCVPTFRPACPNSGGNVAAAHLQDALNTNGDDTQPDRIVLAAGVHTHTDTYELPSGDNDDLEIVGAGPSSTFITISASGNQFVMNLNGARDVTMRDLTIRVPASFPDNGGGGLQAQQDTFENVDIESRNVRSDGIFSFIGGGTFRDGRVYGSNGGSIDVGFGTNGAETGTMVIERTTIEDPSWGVSIDDPQVATYVRRVHIRDPLAYGVRISNGSFAVVENSIVEADTGYPVSVRSDSPATLIATLRHLTIVGHDLDPGDPAIDATVADTVGNGSVNLVSSDLVIAGYEDPLRCEAPTAANVGNVSMIVNYSYFFHSALVEGDCTLSNGSTIDAFDPQVGPPQFKAPGDYRLPLGSPAIDSGNPATATLPAVDYLGALRPVDGDGDGAARRDMGAYELQPAGAPPPGGGDPADPTDPPGGDPVNPPAGKPQTFGAKTLVTLALASKRIAPGKPLRVRVTNRNKFAVTGSLGGRTIRAFAAAGKRKRLGLKAKAFTVGAGAKKVVKLKLSKRLRGMLVRDGKVALRLRAVVRSPAGESRSVKRKVTPKLK
jgi:hypothetical protein